MGNPIVPTYEYGYYGYNVFEVPNQTMTPTTLKKVDKDSRVNTTFNVGSKSVLVDISLNTGDYYKMETNEDDYANLIDFIKTNQIGRIPFISPQVKILMNYTLTDIAGKTIDGGVKIAEATMEDCVIILPIDGITAPYRFAKYFAVDFVIDRFNVNGGTNVRMVRTPFYGTGGMGPDAHKDAFIFYINDIRILGAAGGMERRLPNCMNGGHYAAESPTVLDIERDSVELFNTVWYDLNFNGQSIPGYANSIHIPISIITPMIATTDVREIDSLLLSNSEVFYPGDEPGEIIVDMFKPLIRRPHCPGTLPHDYFKYWEPKQKPVAPDHHGNGSCTQPVFPGPEFPNHGCPIKIDPNNITARTPGGIYTNGGIMKYSWDDLVENGAIVLTRKGDSVVISTPDVKTRGAKITESDIGPILVIPEPGCQHVTLNIGESAFFGYENLEMVYLPKTTRTIGNHAFYGCKSLEEVRAASSGVDGICEICDNAFMNCTSLRKVATSQALDIIGERAFYHCSLLKLTVPPSVSSIGENAFHEMFRVICSPKTDLTGAGISEKDVEFFAEDHPWYNPEDYVETPENPDEGGDINGGNTEEGDPEKPGDDDGSSSGSSEQKPDNPGGNDSEKPGEVTEGGDSTSGGAGNSEGNESNESSNPGNNAGNDNNSESETPETKPGESGGSTEPSGTNSENPGNANDGSGDSSAKGTEDSNGNTEDDNSGSQSGSTNVGEGETDW